jgi:hypothetical protein
LPAEAQKKDKKLAKNLVATWICEGMDIKLAILENPPQNMTEDMKQRLAQQQAILNKGVTEYSARVNGRIAFVFEKDGKANVISTDMGKRKEGKGTWTLEGNTLTLVLDNADLDTDFKKIIVSIIGGRLTAQMIQDNGGYSTNYLFFKKGTLQDLNTTIPAPSQN